MEIKLTQKQLDIIVAIASDKATLQNEYKRLVQREQELILTLAESAGIKLTPSTQVSVSDGKLIFEDSQPVEVEQKKKKTSKLVKHAG